MITRLDWHERIRQLEIILGNEEGQIHADEDITMGESMVPHDEENLLHIEADEDAERRIEGEDPPQHSESESGRPSCIGPLSPEEHVIHDEGDLSYHSESDEGPDCMGPSSPDAALPTVMYPEK